MFSVVSKVFGVASVKIDDDALVEDKLDMIPYGELMETGVRAMHVQQKRLSQKKLRLTLG